MNLPPGVGIVEVSPRDGLQDEEKVLPTSVKVQLIEQALSAGVTRVEAVSFVRPDVVPALADAEAVLAALSPWPGARISALVLNERGLHRALNAGVAELNVVVPASDTFSARNQGVGVEEMMLAAERIVNGASAAGVAATVTLAVAFGCPYEGVVRLDRVRELARRSASWGADEIALADTIGCAVPTEVSELVRSVREDTGASVRVHLHNSRNTGYANAVAALMAGAESLDASIGGIGGCPFAPGASGNIATEDLAFMLERMGVETRIDVSSLIEASEWLSKQLGRNLPGQLSRSGLFPRLTSD